MGSRDGTRTDEGHLPGNLDPIFILSPLPRSGTNFLWDLLRQHPHVAPGRPPIWESYLLKNAGPLIDFAREAQRSWDPVWGPTEHLRPELLRHLGDALVRFMTVEPGRRTLTKSPSIANLDHFFDLFPRAHLVLLIRDGRDVVQSGMATFGWTLEGAARWWAKEIDAIARFERDRHPTDYHYRLVRYEDLVEDWPGELERLLKHLDLPLELFDVDAAARLPLRGSSSHRGGEGDPVHWEPMPRPKNFKGVGKWHSWTPATRERFLEIAGRQLELMGYEL